MTLSTVVFILDPIDHLDVFQFCQGLLAKYDDPRHLPPQQQMVSNEQDKSYRPSAIEATPGTWEVRPENPWSLDNKPMQDLPAWLLTSYRPHAPLWTPEQAAEHDSDCNLLGNKFYDPDEDDCDGDHYSRRACWMSVDFDTAYGYRDSRNWGCGDLHAALLTELGTWLHAQEVQWEWRNEFTGEIYQGFDGLDELGPGSSDASSWFRTVATPAILADLASRGGGRLEIGGQVVDLPDLSKEASA